jgi:tetratricopeptide (TPR) repeat protein
MRQLENPSLSRNARAELCCQVAQELEDVGDYKGAREALSEFWYVVGERPEVAGLSQSTAAEVLLRAGTLTGWLGSYNQSAEAQEQAKNLITESIRIFESHSYTKKMLEAQTELAYCYWREGSYDEARVMLQEVIDKLRADSELKAKAVLRSAIVEWSSLRYNDSLCILAKAAPLFEKIHNHTIKGGYHNALAGVFEDLGDSEQREDYTDRAFVEYAAAAYHFEQAGHQIYRANVGNNVGFLYFKVGKYEEAQTHLDRARRILISLKDKGTVAQVDETRARVFLAQGQYSDAERASRSAVRALDESGRQSLLAEALTTHGIALARLGYYEQSRLNLYRAIETAHHSGAANNAGLAALTLIEELSEHLTVEEMQAVYQRAYQWLAASQHLQTLQRLLKAANQVLSAGSDSERASEKPEASRQGTLREVIRNYEREIIRQALHQSEGSITHAARLLGISYQALSNLLQGRHRDLLHERKPAKPRKRSIMKKNQS